MIEEIAKYIPTQLRNLSGSVFYSGRNAFRSMAPLYVLGLNPGGDPEARPNETVAWHTNKVLEAVPNDWSAYRDESWRQAPPGTSGMQPRVLHMFRQLGLAAGDVPASNVVFVRSKREAALKGKFLELADACWAFHEMALDLLKPRAILCFGGTAGAYVRNRLGAVRKVQEFVETNNRRWRTTCFASRNGSFVVVATHPSIADWTAPSSDPSGLVKRALAT
jgi:hypothetical protein